MNESQLKAVQSAENALLLLAGPGSGKTTVITHRIRHLISNLGVSPDKILVITFTKTAAMEMKERYLHLMQCSDTEVVFGTFHAVFYQILKSSQTYRNISLIQENERIKMIQHILGRLQKEQFYAEPDIGGVIKQISKYKNQIDDHLSDKMLSDTLDESTFALVIREYEDLLKEMKKLDFDDMVRLCYQLLLENSDKRKYWSERFRYILIDEFQDINPLQYEVVRLLTGKKTGLFVVGDDDQSIYGFRGANPNIMKRFLEDYEGATKIVLNQNYRSCFQIVEAANRVIAENRNRFDKQIFPMQNEAGRVVLSPCKTREEETEKMIAAIELLYQENVAYDQMAILCRNNRDFLVFYGALDQRRIPYRADNYHKTMYEHPYIRTIIAYCRYLAGNLSRDNFFRFMNQPVRFIKRAALMHDPVRKEDLLSYYQGNYSMKDVIERLFEQLRRMNHMKPSLGIHYLRKVVGLDRYVAGEISREQYREYETLADNFMEYAKEFSNYDTLLKEIEEKVREVKKNAPKRGIHLYTYHGSKGLEFDHVFLPGLIQGHIPPKQARTQDAIEEERRMFYVAITRAKKTLHLSWTANDQNTVSVFLAPLLSKNYSVYNSSNSTESKNSSKASSTFSYSASSSMYSMTGSSSGSSGFSEYL